MGLDTTHGCYNGTYSSFNRFRYSLGRQIGIDLSDYKGYGNDNGKNLYDIKHELMHLFNHSDCDGELTVEQSESIVKGLDNVLNNFNNEIEADYNFNDKIKTFKEGCLLAIKNNEIVEFY